MKSLFLISIITLLVTSCANKDRKTPSTPSPTPTTTNTASVVQITDANYDEVVRSQKVVLLFFWAPWSAPDRAMMPTIDAVAIDYSGRVKIGKVNVDENPELAGKFKIRGIPTVVVLKDGTEQERVVGLLPKKKVSDLLDKQLH